MRAILCAAMLAASAFTLPAAAQTAPHAAAAAALSVQTTPIADILKTASAKAVLDKELPGLRPFYGRIGSMTLVQIAQSSHGAVGDAKLKTIQAAFDTIR